MSRTTIRRPCNHGLHLFLTIITMGMWGIFVWPWVAIYGRRETVTYPGQYPPELVHGATYAVPAPYVVAAPEPNCVNPYNGERYYDPSRPPLTYPPGHPVQYGR